MFNEGLLDTELFWLSFGNFITYTVISTVIIAEIGFIIWLLLKWLQKNININWSPNLHIGESKSSLLNDSPIETFKKSYKDRGHIEVNLDKKIFINEADNVDIKSEEIETGKVKTQKDKLKKLRGK